MGSGRTDKLRTARAGQICTRPPVQFQLVAWKPSKKALAAICRVQDYIYTPEEGKDLLVHSCRPPTTFSWLDILLPPNTLNVNWEKKKENAK